MAGYIDYLSNNEEQISPEAEGMISELGVEKAREFLFGPKDIPLITGDPFSTEVALPFTEAAVPVIYGTTSIKPLIRTGVNLLKRATKKVPRNLEKTLQVGAKEYTREWGKDVFKGLTKEDIRFDGIMDYGEQGKRAFFTVIKEGHPSHGYTFSGPRLEKVLKVGVGKGKTKIFKARPGQTQHFEIFESLPADLQVDVEAGYLVGGRFVPKAKLEKPSGLLPGPTAKTRLKIPTEGADITESVIRAHDKMLRKGLTTFTERAPLTKVIAGETIGEGRSAYSPMTREMRLRHPIKEDFLHELEHYRKHIIPIS